MNICRRFSSENRVSTHEGSLPQTHRAVINSTQLSPCHGSGTEAAEWPLRHLFVGHGRREGHCLPAFFPRRLLASTRKCKLWRVTKVSHLSGRDDHSFCYAIKLILQLQLILLTLNKMANFSFSLTLYLMNYILRRFWRCNLW